MQEEARVFNKVYGFHITLIPLRSPKTAKEISESIDVESSQHTPAPWQSMPKEQTADTEAGGFPKMNNSIEQQIERIAKESIGDLFLTDSPTHNAKLNKLALSVNDYPVCYLSLTMLVPKGNPLQFKSVQEVLAANRTVGIVYPSLDGLGEASWKMLSGIVPGGEEAVPQNLVRFFERQYDLLEALEQGTIDSALVWNATSLSNFLLVKYGSAYNSENEKIMRDAEQQKDYGKLRIILQSMYEHLMETKSFAEEVVLENNPGERYVTRIHLIALGTTSYLGYCERFADFMRSRQGKDILQRFGFVTE